MPTYRVPIYGQVEVNADDSRLALAILDDPTCFDDGLAELVDWSPDGEPVEVEP